MAGYLSSSSYSSRTNVSEYSSMGILPESKYCRLKGQTSVMDLKYSLISKKILQKILSRSPYSIVERSKVKSICYESRLYGYGAYYIRYTHKGGGGSFIGLCVVCRAVRRDRRDISYAYNRLLAGGINKFT